jgi:hypothetical protein
MSSTKYTVRPRFGKIPTASAYSGLGRTSLYDLAEQHQGLFKKFGTATLVDLNVLDKILDQLPDAVINVSAAKVPEDQAPADCEVAEAAANVSDCDSKITPESPK